MIARSLIAALLVVPATTADLPRIRAKPGETRPTAMVALDDARWLAREQRYDEAVAQYDRMFLGGPLPTDLAIEYFVALSGAAGGWETARDGLADLVRKHPADLPAQLAYAEALIRRDAARADGIERLQALTHHPAVAEAAAAALRTASQPDPDPARLRASDAAEVRTLLTQMQRADWPAAEQSLRAAIARRPGDGGALVALAVLLDREGRARDAEDLLRQAEGAGSDRLVAQARARHWREQAGQAGDSQVWLTLLQQATRAIPADPVIRLEFARALVTAGRLAEARAVMAHSLGARAGPEALHAGIAFAHETRDPETAAALLARLPSSARTLDLRAVRVRAKLDEDIAEALALGLPEAAHRLLTLATQQPDQDGARGAAIARALAAAGDSDSARAAIAAARGATPEPAVPACLTYAGALLDLGDPVSAQRSLAGLDAATLTSAQRTEFFELRSRLAVRRSDELNELGQQAAAYQALAPALARRPRDPELYLALARLYYGAGRPAEARRMAETLLGLDPANAEARRIAVTTAMTTGDRDRADALAREGIKLTPLDPQIWVAKADIAQARGDNETALRALRRARGLRTRQLDPRQPADPSRAAIALAMLAPEDLAPGAPLSVPPASATSPTAGLEAETDDDGDQVMVRGRMLDTAATDLPPPHPPDRPAAPARPPKSVTMAASMGSQDNDAPDRVADPQSDPFGAPPTDRPPVRPLKAAPGETDPGWPMLADLAAPATPADPMTARIDHDIAALGEPSPGTQAAIAFRGRSGSPGTSQLAEITVPLTSDISDGGQGRIRLATTPTFLRAGSVPSGAGTRAQFGSLALGLRPGVPGIRHQNANGSGLEVDYSIGSFFADVGSTPLGFREQNVVGGMAWAPTVAEGVRLRLTGERRAVTDSLLSYAGTRDPRTGRIWGGVTYDRGTARLEFSAGSADLYVVGGGGVLEGRSVKSNTETEAGAGGSVALLKDSGQELRLGVDLVYESFAKNLDGFTLGQGGYFSPQSYFTALLPVTFTDRPTRALSYEIGGTAGFQTYRTDSSPIFPDNSDLQAALRAQQANPATAIAGVNTQFAAQNRTGFAGGAHASIDYRLTGGFHIGGKVDYEHTGNYNQAVGLLYFRTVFNEASFR